MSLGGNQKEDKKMGNIYNEIREIKHKIVYLTPEKLAASVALMSVLDELY